MDLSVDQNCYFLNGPFGSLSLYHIHCWFQIEPNKIKLSFRTDHQIPKGILDSDDTIVIDGTLTEQLQKDLIAVRRAAIDTEKKIVSIQGLQHLINIKESQQLEDSVLNSIIQQTSKLFANPDPLNESVETLITDVKKELDITEPLSVVAGFLKGPFGSYPLDNLNSWFQNKDLPPSITFVFVTLRDSMPVETRFTCKGELTPELYKDLNDVKDYFAKRLITVDVQNCVLKGEFGTVRLEYLDSWCQCKDSIVFKFSINLFLKSIPRPKGINLDDNTFTCVGQLTPELEKDLISVKSEWNKRMN